MNDKLEMSFTNNNLAKYNEKVNDLLDEYINLFEKIINLNDSNYYYNLIDTDYENLFVVFELQNFKCEKVSILENKYPVNVKEIRDTFNSIFNSIPPYFNPNEPKIFSSVIITTALYRYYKEIEDMSPKFDLVRKKLNSKNKILLNVGDENKEKLATIIFTSLGTNIIGCTIENFLSWFLTSRPPLEKIQWHGDANDLVFLFEKLRNEDVILNNRIQSTIVNVFVNEDGHEYKPRSLSSALSTMKGDQTRFPSELNIALRKIIIAYKDFKNLEI